MERVLDLGLNLHHEGVGRAGEHCDVGRVCGCRREGEPAWGCGVSDFGFGVSAQSQILDSGFWSSGVR